MKLVIDNTSIEITLSEFIDTNKTYETLVRKLRDITGKHVRWPRSSYTGYILPSTALEDKLADILIDMKPVTIYRTPGTMEIRERVSFMGLAPKDNAVADKDMLCLLKTLNSKREKLTRVYSTTNEKRYLKALTDLSPYVSMLSIT